MPAFYRIEKRRYAAHTFDGTGGLFAAGRWHRKGVPVAYASEHVAVAAMEKVVWLGTLEDAVAGDFVVVSVEIPRRAIATVALADLPAHWSQFPHPPETQEIGMRWLAEGRTAALQVPSAVVPGSVNVLLNPRHAAAAGFAVSAPAPFRWDARLFQRPGTPA